MKNYAALISFILFICANAKAMIDFSAIEKSIVTVYQIDLNKNIVAQGTGFFIDSETIVSNFHVVFNKESSLGIYNTEGVKIETNTGEVFYPTYVSFDSVRDIALLKLGYNERYKYHIPISKRRAKVGDNVWAVGNPLGLTNSWSNGIISSVRLSPARDTIFQFTAALSSGSSGGPVLNDLGQAIGISTFKLKEGENLNFFLDINVIKKTESSVNFYLTDKEFKEGNSISNYIELAKLETTKGNYLKALSYLDEAIRIDSLDYDIYKAKANNYLELNDLNRAEENILKTESISAFLKGLDFEVSRLWAVLHEKQGRFKEAAQDYLRWSENVSIYTDSENSVSQWGFLKAANCFNKIHDYSSAKHWISKVTEPQFMDNSFYILRSMIYMSLVKNGDRSITQNMLCSDLMKVKKNYEAGSDFEAYKKIKNIFDQVCY